MLDKKKLNLKARVKTVCTLFLGLVLGVAFASAVITPSHKSSSKTSTTKTTSPSTLSSKNVKNFLMAYYTRKDLGENRSRYQDYMTKNAYQNTIKTEDQPTNAVYKGFVVDQEFESADIFIDADKKQAIVTVNYVNQSLTKEDDRSTGVRQHKTATLLLTYVNENGKLKVNDIRPKKLTDNTDTQNQQNVQQERNNAPVKDDNNDIAD
ncbi:hypothetical protein [Fructobacillus evanidus]|uniref:Parvulin-like peptidyl-prolyl isomerase n=1 Tax=Fructobacillus evanidus TaxID=3064281 RepID=A0ABN9YZF9_9LACO|nr:hypothetical protein R54837_OMAIDLJD_00322 [Fructobacillus sp. LMG 32999]CAK1246635.1 hypothetical protein R55214_HHFBAMCI_01083 [Fructobacillus sp. LMG 32999]